MLMQKLSNAARRMQNRVRATWQWVHFGDITEVVRGTAGDGVVAEVEYRGRGGKVVGYWAYGYFDPSLPYRG